MRKSGRNDSDARLDIRLPKEELEAAHAAHQEEETILSFSQWVRMAIKAAVGRVRKRTEP